MLFPNWPAPLNIKALTFCRPDKDINNYTNLPDKIYWLDQVHSNIAIEINNKNLQEHNFPKADASYTTESNVACVIKTADCLPILIASKASKNNNWVSAIHAGWRGLANGIIENTLKNYPANPNNLMAWLGPAISSKHFEVGQEVYHSFVESDKNFNYLNYSQAFTPSDTKLNKYYADLFLLAELKLKKLGILDIYHSHQCTYSNPELFYSYRRDNGTPDRLITMIWIENK